LGKLGNFKARRSRLQHKPNLLGYVDSKYPVSLKNLVYLA